MGERVTLTKQGEIAVITVDNPPVNALSREVTAGLREKIARASDDDAVKAVVLIGAGSTFIAGADIKEFTRLTPADAGRLREIHDVFAEVEDCPKPIVCAIHGTAFGGGLELAQACHYRIALSSTLLGQPEVQLGLIPGAGGTQRLPRLVGVAKALEMCGQGRPIRAPEARDLGLVDSLVEGDLLDAALSYARELVTQGTPPRKTRKLTEKLGDEAANAPLFAAARQMASKAARGQIAPLKAIDAIEASTRLPFDDACRLEADLFQECLFSPQARGLIHIFLSERECAKVPGAHKPARVGEIRQAAVMGCGTMGGGIAMVYANAGIPVVVREVDQGALDRGLETIRKNYLSSVKKGRLTEAQMEERMARIRPGLTYDGFEEADIVVEAVFEDMALKRKVFRELSGICKPEAVLATNTSSLDIDEIASVTDRPRQVIGHHFFSPANVMRLLEVVRGKETSPEVIGASMALARRLKKVGVLAGNCRGFIGNRMLFGYVREAQFLVEEGAKPEEVDAALFAFGMAMGPLAMLDLAGIDVGWRVRQAAKHLEPADRRQPRVEDRLYELGRYGQKTSAGWYRYEPGSRQPIPDPEVHRIVEECSREAGIERREIAPDEIIERTIYPLINEGARILEEGVALRAGDIDVVYIYGYGFPAWRGGPMWYADTQGLDKIHRRICELQQTHGDLWRPAPLLERLAEEGKTFAQLDEEKRAA